MSIYQNRKPLYCTQSYSARKCITKCPNCYNCKGQCKDSQQGKSIRPTVSPLKNKDQYPYFLEFQNGIYQGDFQNLLKENFGIFFSDDSIFYLGCWKSDQISGFGYIFFPKGGYLYALFEKNKINGVGILNYPNGNRLVGYWKKSKMHGPFFHYFLKKKLWVQCEYVDGLLMRYGKEEISENIPEMLREYPELRKILEDLRSENFLKMFKNTKEQVNYLKLTKDLKYLGFSTKKIPNGLGIVFHQNSPLFYGVFKEGVLNGFGRMNLENGDIYEGMFKEGSFHGLGMYYNKKNDNFIFGNFQKNSCINKQKIGSKYPISLITNFKKEEHRKTLKFFNKVFNFSILSLGPEFSDENFLEESHPTSSYSFIYNLPLEKTPKKTLENIEVVHKSSSKDFQRTQIIEAKTNLNIQKKIFNELELFQDMIHGKFYQFPRNCLDFYDNNIESYEVISQNNNIYNLTGNIRITHGPKKRKIKKDPLIFLETYEDNFKVFKEQTFRDKKSNFLEKSVNYLNSTLKKDDNQNKTGRKNNFDKENLNEIEHKEPENILFLKKLSKSTEKKYQKPKNHLDNELNVSLYDGNSENYKDVSRISSIRIIEKNEKTPEKFRFFQNRIKENLNTNELNNLEEQIISKMTKSKGIFEVSEDFKLSYNDHVSKVGQKFKGNESFRSSYSLVNQNKSQNRISKNMDDENNMEKSFLS